jgi:LacI family transcriptional regulator
LIQEMPAGLAGAVFWSDSHSTDDAPVPSVPVCCVTAAEPSEGMDAVVLSVRAASQCLTTHLLSHGYRSLAMINGVPDSDLTAERAQGFGEALVAHGLDAVEPFTAQDPQGARAGYDALQSILERGRLPEAIVVATDLLTAGVIECVHDHALCVPGDLAIACCDDSPLTWALQPAVTAVRQPFRRAGALAVETLTWRLHHPTAPPRVTSLSFELVLRASCGCPSVP